MNCGCLPDFPGEHHEQLLNAIVHWEGLVGGDFETFQKRVWEIAEGSEGALDSRIWWKAVLCIWLYLFIFLRDFYFSHFPLPQVCRDGGCLCIWLNLWRKRDFYFSPIFSLHHICHDGSSQRLGVLLGFESGGALMAPFSPKLENIINSACFIQLL